MTSEFQKSDTSVQFHLELTTHAPSQRNILQTVAFFLSSSSSSSCFFSHSFTMASATRLPLKSILFTTAIVASTGASRINLRNLLIRTFTGPGSYSRIAAILIVLVNLKNVPGTWHVCNCTTKVDG